MKPALRTQVDDLAEEYSRLIQIDCSDMPDMTRQEFKQETDINYLISRFGANTPLRQPIYGEIDYDMDLQRALTALSDAKQAIRKLPEPIRTKYAHLHRFIQGIESGELKDDLDKHVQAAQTTGTENAATTAKPPKDTLTPTGTETAS